VLVPYASIADFQQISFIDVMRGEVPQALLRDRLLLVGVTAKGIGDSIPTPRSGADSRIPGVLYQANLLNMLLAGEAIVPLAASARLPTSILAVLLPVLLLLYQRTRRAWAIFAGS